MFYLYNEAGADHGPFTLDELRSRVIAGELPYDKLVRRTRSADWQPLYELSPGFVPAPPLKAAKNQCQKCGSKRADPEWGCLFTLLLIGIVITTVGFAMDWPYLARMAGTTTIAVSLTHILLQLSQRNACENCKTILASARPSACAGCGGWGVISKKLANGSGVVQVPCQRCHGTGRL